MWRSVPQTPAATTATMTSPSPGRRSGRSVSPTFPGPGASFTSAFTPPPKVQVTLCYLVGREASLRARALFQAVQRRSAAPPKASNTVLLALGLMGSSSCLGELEQLVESGERLLVHGRRGLAD